MILNHQYRSQSIDHRFTSQGVILEEREFELIHNWPEPETAQEEIIPSKLQDNLEIENTEEGKVVEFNVPHQEVLLLHGPRQKYAHAREQPIPALQDDREMLVAVDAVGLNPIDWKAPYVIPSHGIADQVI